MRLSLLLPAAVRTIFAVVLRAAPLALCSVAPAARAEEGHAPAPHGDAAAPASVPTGALCTGFGPQTPRDIRSGRGANAVDFPLAPAASEMNLCNIHTHTNAEHRGPGFSVPAGSGEHGGFACDLSRPLTEAELRPVDAPHFGGAAPGDTIEVHWVYSSCDVGPGPGLGACLSDACANPVLRVEAQVFLLVNDPGALDFASFAALEGRQPRTLPRGTGRPVVFRGSTTGPAYSDAICSPMQVTWSVRPYCTLLDVNSLHRWAADGNVFGEDHSHGVRTLVTAPELLSPID